MPVIQQVVFTDARSRCTKESLVLKLERVMDELNLAKKFAGKTVAIKTHFGSPYCTRYLRPHYLKIVVDKVKEAGGTPFVTDTTTLNLLYQRGTAPSYLKIATSHGFTPTTLGAPIIIADGLLGNDHVKTKMNGLQLKNTFIAKGIVEADFLLSITHFKGHGLTGIGGTCKNLSLGCTSK